MSDQVVLRDEHKDQLLSKSIKDKALSSSCSASPGLHDLGPIQSAGQHPLNANHFVSRLLKPGRRTKTSPVWDFFHIEPQYICRATCNICWKSVSRGQCASQLGTSTLQRHLQAKHPSQWALARHTEGTAGSDPPDKHLSVSALDSPDLSSSWPRSPEPDPNILASLEENPVAYQDQSPLFASESPELSGSLANAPDFITRLEQDPVAGEDQLPFRQKLKNEIFKTEKVQLNKEFISQIVNQDVDPVSTFPIDCIPEGIEGCLLGQSSSFEPVLTPRKRAKRSKSLVWKFFFIDPECPSKTACMVCSRSVSRGRPGSQLGTSTLQRHLLAKHPVHWSMANEGSIGLDQLEYAFGFSLPPFTAKNLCSTSARIKTSCCVESMQVDSAGQKSVAPCVDSLQGSSTNENIKPEPVLLNCASKEKLCVGILKRESRHWTNENPKMEPVSLSNCTDKDELCAGRLHRELGHWTSENTKMELVSLSNCAEKEEPFVDSLHGEQGSSTNENIKPEPVLLNCASKEKLCVGRLKRERRHWTNENPKIEPVSLANCTDKDELCAGRLHRELGHWTSENTKMKLVSLSNCAEKEEHCVDRSYSDRRHQTNENPELGTISLPNSAETEDAPLEPSPTTAAICHDSSGCVEESVLNDSYPVVRVHVPGKRWRRAKSPVWLFFYIDPQFPSHAVCTICKKSVSRGRPGTPLGTSTLQRHLLARHPADWDMASKDGQEVESRVAKPCSHQLETSTVTSGRGSTINQAGGTGSTINQAGRTKGVLSLVSHTANQRPQRQEVTVVNQEVTKVKQEVQEVEQTPSEKVKSRKTGHRVTSLSKRPCQAKKLFYDVVSPVVARDADPHLISGVCNQVNAVNIGRHCDPLSRKRTKRITSPVWNFFYTDPECSSHAICIVCKRSVSRGKPGTQLGTSTLQRHLLAKHPVHWHLVIMNEEGPGAVQ